MSMLFHLAIIVVATVGLPFISKPPPEMAQPIPVELATMADLTQTTKIAEAPQIKKPDAEPPKPAPERPKQAPKQVSSAPPPPKQDDLALPDKKAEKIKPPEKAKIKPPEPKKPIAKPKPDEKTPPSDDPFQSLLKNLQEAKPEPSKAEGTKVATPDQATPAPLAEQMTASDFSALSEQMKQCWNVLAGARYAEDIVVDVKMIINADRTVAQASIVDTMRYNTDNIFRAAADSALRAIRDPQCKVLELPPEKYNTWKELTFRFDPRNML